jgi:hypothetical protein
MTSASRRLLAPPMYLLQKQPLQWCVGLRSDGPVGPRSGLWRTVQGIGGCCGSLAELFRSRGSPPSWPARCPVVSPRGGAGLVVKTSTASGEDSETIWTRSEYDLRDPANPKFSETILLVHVLFSNTVQARTTFLWDYLFTFYKDFCSFFWGASSGTPCILYTVKRQLQNLKSFPSELHHITILYRYSISYKCASKQAMKI